MKIQGELESVIKESHIDGSVGVYRCPCEHGFLVRICNLINPRCTCTERVTVVGSCVCVCLYVCPNTLFWQYAQLEV